MTLAINANHFILQISEIVSHFERKGFKLVAIKLVVPSKEFAKKHYYDLKERPFFNGLCEFLSSGPVLAMVSPLKYSTPITHYQLFVDGVNISSCFYESEFSLFARVASKDYD